MEAVFRAPRPRIDPRSHTPTLKISNKTAPTDHPISHRRTSCWYRTERGVALVQDSNQNDRDVLQDFHYLGVYLGERSGEGHPSSEMQPRSVGRL